jgi:hypothetical protein
MWNQVEQALNNSTARMITGIANVLPGLVALTLAVAVAGAVGWIAGAVVMRFLQRVDFDSRVGRWSGAAVTETGSSVSPTLLLVRLVRWSVVFLGFLIGVAAVDSTLTSRLVGQFFGYVPNLVVGVLLVLAGKVAARYVGRSVLIGAVNMNLQYAHLLSVGVKWLILVFTTAMALNHLGIGGPIVGSAFAILFGGIVLALALAVGLGARDFVSRSLEQKGGRDALQQEEPFHHV